MKPIDILKSKTFWGALLYALSIVLQADVISSAVVLEAIGIILGGAGLRSAIAQGSVK